MDIWHLKLGFQYPIKHSLATHTDSENLVVKVTTDRGDAGYGEGIPRGFVTGEMLPESLNFLKKELAPAAFLQDFASARTFLADLESLEKDPAESFPAAVCAMETALLDAAGRTWGRSVSDLLGFRAKDSVVYSAVLPMAGEAQLARFLQLVKLQRMAFLKVKVGRDDDLQVLKMARDIMGWDIDLRVDANSAWTAQEAVAHIQEMAPYRLSAVEQPVAKEDFEGLREVSQAVDLPIIADESLCTRADAQRLIDLKACRIFNIRLSKCGGLRRAGLIRQMAEEAGVRCQLGCHVGETSILSAAGRHFALGNGDLVYVEGSLSPYLLSKDPVARPIGFGVGGRAHGLNGPGLGVEVLEPVLDELALSRFSLAAP